MPKKEKDKEDKEEQEEDKEEQEEEEEEKESKLEEELEPQIDTRRLADLLQTQIRSKSPSLEQVEVDRGPAFSLEQGVDQGGFTSKKEEDVKYETVKDEVQDYENPSKRQTTSPGEIQTISTSSHIDMASVGRQPERIGQEFHMTQPEELSNHPGSMGDYDTVQTGKSSDFKGEKTFLQKEMEKRYEIKK